MEPQHTTDEALDEKAALEQRCGIKVEHVLAISSVLQALPTCVARGSIRRRALPTAATVSGKFAVHHLIPIVFAPHDILWRVRDWWDQNDPSVNGVALPISRSQSLACGPPFHAGPHHRYSRWIGEALDASGTPQGPDKPMHRAARYFEQRLFSKPSGLADRRISHQRHLALVTPRKQVELNRGGLPGCRAPGSARSHP